MIVLMLTEMRATSVQRIPYSPAHRRVILFLEITKSKIFLNSVLFSPLQVGPSWPATTAAAAVIDVALPIKQLTRGVSLFHFNIPAFTFL